MADNGETPVGAFLNDERVRAFGKALSEEVLKQITPIIGELKPGGRPVQVMRRHLPQQPACLQTVTTPQLLAELNDNITDLIVELQIANNLVMQQMGVSEAMLPVRRKRRRE
jgi:hypothetical protein